MRKEGGIPKPDAGIYIHFPFCKQKCLYCDFYSLEKEIPASYLEALFSEIHLYSSLSSEFNFTTLYLGGGTPSLLSPLQLEKIFQQLQNYNFLTNLKEITLEANPESLTKDLLLSANALGINRLSLGIQSLDDNILKKIGRLATRQINLKAMNLSKKYFTNLSLDLIYGIPGQNIPNELINFLEIQPSHLSAYCLTLAPETPLSKFTSEYSLPDEILNQQFEQIHSTLTAHNYNHYEISNYGLNENRSLHNLHYWRRHPYLGLGAGASGFLGKKRYTNSQLPFYQTQLKNHQFPIAQEEILNGQDEVLETLMLGLRTQEGISWTQLQNYPQLIQKAREYLSQGLLTQSQTQLLPTLQGWEILDFMLKGWWNALD